MLRTTSRIAKAGFRDQNEAELLVCYLREQGYSPGIRGMFAGLFGLVGLPEPSQELMSKVLTPSPPMFRRNPNDILGDFFLTDNCVLVLNGDADILQASAIQLTAHEGCLADFCGAIETGIRANFDRRRVRGMDFKWAPLPAGASNPSRRRRSESSGLNDTDIQNKNPEYDTDEASLSNLLTNEHTRDLLLRIAKIDRIQGADIEKDKSFESLLSSGLISE